MKIFKGCETAERLNYSNYMYLFTFPLCAVLLRFFLQFSSALSLSFQLSTSLPGWKVNSAWTVCVGGS